MASIDAAPSVISLVPSLTETFIDCGVPVVGRTRYCVHPEEKVKTIPVVGGTKRVDWAKCESLNADLVVMDREENTREMADECPLPWTAIHITSLEEVGRELTVLAEVLSSESLKELADKWQALSDAAFIAVDNLEQLPGVIQPIGDQAAPKKRVEYLIWRNPWMAIGPGTFIASVLQRFGVKVDDRSEPYPELSDGDMTRDDTYYLFSSEPYPFARHRKKLEDLGVSGAIIDAEVYSWYGVRSYRLLREFFDPL